MQSLFPARNRLHDFGQNLLPNKADTNGNPKFLKVSHSNPTEKNFNQNAFASTRRAVIDIRCPPLEARTMNTASNTTAGRRQLNSVSLDAIDADTFKAAHPLVFFG